MIAASRRRDDPDQSSEFQSPDYLSFGIVNINLKKISLERAEGFEPSTPTLARLCSTPELRSHHKFCIIPNPRKKSNIDIDIKIG